MALYDGFFDAEKIDPNGPDDYTNYDRTYNSGHFIDYFSNFIGSGVCIYNNPDSYRIMIQDGALTVAPGYLFIRGFWQKCVKDGDKYHSIPLPAAGVYAVVARLNTGKYMIDLVVEPKAADYSSDDVLVLAYVTVSSAGTATVEDTRYDTTICGVIDSIGNMSGKIEWAINYINTEINAKLEQAERAIANQAAILDAKIAEATAAASRIQPPPVGTIKFSASKDIDETWLKCDGSFVNETDYPELVEALGKLTPGVDDFRELLGAANGEYMSNCALYNGYAWVYLVGSKKLVGYQINGSNKKEISVSGADDLVQLAAVDTVLSICGGAVYLAQNNQKASTFVLLESTGFTGNNSSISMNTLAVASFTTSLDMSRVVPKVVDVNGSKYMALGTRSQTQTQTSGGALYHYYLYYLQWTSGNFSSASSLTAELNGALSGTITDLSKRLIATYYSFTSKNSQEILIFRGFLGGLSNSTAQISIGSLVQGIYGSYMSTGTLPTYNQTDATKSLTSDPQVNIIPIFGNNEYMYRAEITNRKLKITSGMYNPVTLYDFRTIDITLPSRATLFKESVCYASTQGLWFVFVGTGLLFSTSLADDTWGYLDTQDTLGTITQFGCADYDAGTNTLYISGVASNGVPKLGMMRLPDLYDYANDGAWLPMIAADGVPAYIKAVSDGSGGGGGGGDSGTVAVTVNVTIDGRFSNYCELLFNGEALVTGTYTRYLKPGEKFTAGLRTKMGTGTAKPVVKLSGTTIASGYNTSSGIEKTAAFNVSDYISSGINLAGTTE